MAQTLTFPGVYIEEVPSAVRPITGVATSIAAFVDYFTRGPIDTAVQILSMADFEREFGGLNVQSEASYAVHQFFLNGGGQAWIVRVGATSASPDELATATLDIDDTTATALVRVTAGERIRGTSVDNPGTWGNFLRVEVDHDIAVPADPLQTADELFNLTVGEVAVHGGQQVTVRTETYRNVTFRPGAVNNVLEVVNAGSKLVQLELLGTLATPFTAVLPAATGTVGDALPASPTIPADGDSFNVSVNGGSDIVCTFNYGGTTPADYPTLRAYVEGAIRAQAGTDPKLANVSVRLWGNGSTDLPYRFAVVARSGAGEITPTDQLSFNNSTADDLGLGSGVTPNDLQYAPAGSGLGGDGVLPGPAELEGLRANKTGLYALEDADLFNILCIPRSADLGASDLQAIVAAGEKYCEERRAFMIVDIPATVGDPPAMQSWMSTNDSLRHTNAAVYFPRTLVPDPLNDFRPRSLAASGTVAGLYAATDAARGVWKAPAGTGVQLRNVSQLAYVETDGENGTLNPLGINSLRNFPVFGSVVWGGRTLDGADQRSSQWKYIPVRRLALFLEESLYRGTKWVVFEPNDEPLWAQIRLNVGAFMHNLFVQGAFQGTTPREAYFVKCDKETTTQNDIDNGRVNIIVGFAPLKPAEFVVIRIQQLAGQIET
jgi:phage tail sheath protein FI